MRALILSQGFASIAICPPPVGIVGWCRGFKVAREQGLGFRIWGVVGIAQTCPILFSKIASCQACNGDLTDDVHFILGFLQGS